MYKWHWKTFDQLSAKEVYQILAVRQEVFVVEQDCPYQDADGLDQTSMHLFTMDDAHQHILAYLRVVAPGEKYDEPSIGRVLTSERARGKGLGKQMTEKAMQLTQQTYPGKAVRISAQEYLIQFYAEFGFETVSEPYDEDGIPHIEMLAPAMAAN